VEFLLCGGKHTRDQDETLNPIQALTIAASLPGAAERSGAGHAVQPVRVRAASRWLGSVGYDQSHAMTEATRLAATGRKGRVRARVWQDALAAHAAGRAWATEVRESDFVGPGAVSALGG